MSEAAHPRDRLKRELGPLDAIFLVVASVIGAGIFFTPGAVAQLLPHPGWIFAVWAVGGLLSLAGALANAELGAMFPHAGGNYVYLRHGVHPAAGFMVGWLSFFVIYTGTIAALAAAFGAGVAASFGLSEGWELGVAIGVTIASSVLNYVGVRWGALANNLTSILKIVAIAAFVIVGPLIGSGDWSRVFARGDAIGEVSLAAFGLAMSPVLFSYLGWNAPVYVASEIRAPGRNVPLSLFAGLALCTVAYLAVNAVYLYALPMDEMRGVEDAGRAAAGALFGPVAGGIVGAFVLLSVLGTLNATVLVGPRIAYAMALDGLFFGGVDRVSAAYRTPSVAIALQCIVAVGLLLLLRGFPAALDFTTFAILLATIADVIALYRLRLLQPDRHRPYRAWGYPWVPGLYLVVNVGIAVALVQGRPFECLVASLALAAGLPFFWLFGGGRGEDRVDGS